MSSRPPGRSQKVNLAYSSSWHLASSSSAECSKKNSGRVTMLSVQAANAPGGPPPKKSVALSGIAAGNTALCTVGRSGNDLHYRGYDILDFGTTSEFEEIAYLLIHGKLPNVSELAAYK